MVQFHLSPGAHLLLWVFPLALTLGAITAHILEGRRHRR